MVVNEFRWMAYLWHFALMKKYVNGWGWCIYSVWTHIFLSGCMLWVNTHDVGLPCGHVLDISGKLRCMFMYMQIKGRHTKEQLLPPFMWLILLFLRPFKCPMELKWIHIHLYFFTQLLYSHNVLVRCSYSLVIIPTVRFQEIYGQKMLFTGLSSMWYCSHKIIALGKELSSPSSVRWHVSVIYLFPQFCAYSKANDENTLLCCFM